MRNRLLNITLTWGLDLLSILILIAIALLLYQMGLGDHRIFVFFVIMLTALLPVFNHLHDVIDSSVSSLGYDDLFVKTVDAVLNMRSFDEILKETFDQILDFMKIRSGILIFYYPDRDEYSIFYQKNRKKRMIRNARIENGNILFNVIKGPDDIIVRSRLTGRDNYDRAILQEMEKLHGETMVPIYFQTTFLGVIVTGERKRKFSPRELSLLKIFASKIAILAINNFFLNDLLKKKELEKEYELASKIHDRFMPEPEINIGRVAVRIHHKTSSLMTREFYDAFANHGDPDDIRLAAYRLRGDITGTSIYMPGIQALIQSYSRLGNSPRETAYKLLANMKEREIIDEELAVFMASVSQKGSVVYYNHGYPAPLIYRHATGSLADLPRRQGDSELKFRMEQGDILIICSEAYSAPLAGEPAKYSNLVRENQGLSLSKLRGILVKALPSRSRGDDRDTLLILLRLEDAS